MELGLFISLVIVIMTLILYAHLIFIHSKETIIIKDFLRKYRVYILTFLVISFLTLIPRVFYIVMRIYGIDDDNLRNLATLSESIGPFAQAIAFEVIFFYRKKE